MGSNRDSLPNFGFIERQDKPGIRASHFGAGLVVLVVDYQKGASLLLVCCTFYSIKGIVNKFRKASFSSLLFTFAQEDRSFFNEL